MSAFRSYIEGETICTPVKVAYTDTAGRSSALPAGRYYLIATTDCWVRRGTSAEGALLTAAVDDFPLTAGMAWPLIVTVDDVKKGDQYVSALRQTDSGSLYCCKVSR